MRSDPQTVYIWLLVVLKLLVRELGTTDLDSLHHNQSNLRYTCLSTEISSIFYKCPWYIKINIQ